MKIVYHHFENITREAMDKAQGWWTCPPELICNKKEEEKLIKAWKFFNGKDAYITDPLGHTQCLYVMLSQLPLSNFIKSFIKKEHKYDNDNNDKR